MRGSPSRLSNTYPPTKQKWKFLEDEFPFQKGHDFKGLENTGNLKSLCIHCMYWVVALSHAIYLKLTPLLRARRKNRISRHRQNSHHQQQITMGTAHSAYPLTSPNLNKTRPALCKTKGNSIQFHTANSKSQWARLIQHIHWHHQVLTKPCAHCVEHQENSFQPSHQRQQITLCTAHSTHQPLTSPNLNQTMRTLWRTPRKLIPTLTPTTANHTVHRSLITAWKI